MRWLASVLLVAFLLGGLVSGACAKELPAASHADGATYTPSHDGAASLHDGDQLPAAKHGCCAHCGCHQVSLVQLSFLPSSALPTSAPVQALSSLPRVERLEENFRPPIA